MLGGVDTTDTPPPQELLAGTGAHLRHLDFAVRVLIILLHELLHLLPKVVTL